MYDEKVFLKKISIERVNFLSGKVYMPRKKGFTDVFT
jgi:hypothetical protein